MSQAPNYFISSLAQTLNVGGGDSSIQLSTIYTPSGEIVSTADFATFGRGIITINPLSVTSVEFASFTGITPGVSPAGTLTNTLRGLSFTSNAQIPSNQKFNVTGTTVIISFGTHNIQDIVDYINNAAISGGVPATTTVLGLSKLSVPPVLGPSPVVVGNNDYRVGANNFAVATSGTDDYIITLSNAPAAYVKGQQYSFQADVSNTGVCTLNINGLGAKTIKKNVSSNLDTGDILANQIIVVEYDGTNMQIINPHVIDVSTQIIGVLPVANGGTGLVTKNYNSGVVNGTTTGTTVIAHGLGKTPAHIKIHAVADGNNNVMSDGTYDGTTQQCIYTIITADADKNTSVIIFLTPNSASGTNTQGAATMDATNITITWASTNGGTVSFLLWEAWGI